MHNGQPKQTLKDKRKVVVVWTKDVSYNFFGLDGLLEIVVLQVMAESVRAGTYLRGLEEPIKNSRLKQMRR